jgi:hypothetical protein
MEYEGSGRGGDDGVILRLPLNDATFDSLEKTGHLLLHTLPGNRVRCSSSLNTKNYMATFMISIDREMGSRISYHTAAVGPGVGSSDRR